MSKLPDFWWVLNKEGMPQAYVCPFLMTLSIFYWRLKGRDAYWSAATKNSKEEWSETAAAVCRKGVSVGEIRSPFPQSWAKKECAFWNSFIGVRLPTRKVKGFFAD